MCSIRHGDPRTSRSASARRSVRSATTRSSSSTAGTVIRARSATFSTARASVVRYEQGSAGNRYIAAPYSIMSRATRSDSSKLTIIDPEAGEAFFQERLERQSGTDVGLYTATQAPGDRPAKREGRRDRRLLHLVVGRDLCSDGRARSEASTRRIMSRWPSADICDRRGLQLLVRLHPHLRFKHACLEVESGISPNSNAAAQSSLNPKTLPTVTRSFALPIRWSPPAPRSASKLRISGFRTPSSGTWVGGRLGASVEVEDERGARAVHRSNRNFAEGPRESAAIRLLLQARGKAAARTGRGHSPQPSPASTAGLSIGSDMRFRSSASCSSAPPHPGSAGCQIGHCRPAGSCSPYRHGLFIGAPQDSQGKAARSGATKSRRASTENSRSRE